MSSARSNQLVEAGLWLRLSGDHQGARRLFDQALKLDPANARAKQLIDSAAPLPAAPPQAPPIPTPPPANPFARQDPPGGYSGSSTAIWGNPESGQPSFGQSLSGPLPPPEPGPPPEATTAWDSQSNPGVHIEAVGPDMGVAMDLVAADMPRPPEPSGADLTEEVQTLLRGAKDLLELDDHTGAMDLIAKAQELAPTDPEVLKLRENSERTLETMLESKLGNLQAMPRVKLKDDEIIWLNLDHRAGFVLAQIDGTVSFDDLFAVSGMSRLDTARILAQLIEEGVIGA
ncbi:MAG: tetratricopeptide repeat protein [Myxococcaceae bacterium]